MDKTDNQEIAASDEDLSDIVPESETIYALRRILPKGGISGVWRVGLKRQGHHISRAFKDSAYGSAKAAFIQALAYRDSVMRALPPITNREKAAQLKSNNTSGVPGVYCSGPTARRWVAYLATPDRILSKGFSIREHGEDGAKALAIEQRQIWLAGMPAAFTTLNEEADAVAMQQFPAQLQYVPNTTNSHFLSKTDIEAVLEEIDERFDRLRPLRLYVSIRCDRSSRLRGVVSLTPSPCRVLQTQVGGKSRAFTEALTLIGQRLRGLVAELCGEQVADTFADNHLPQLLDLQLFKRTGGTTLAIFITRQEVLPH